VLELGNLKETKLQALGVHWFKITDLSPQFRIDSINPISSLTKLPKEKTHLTSSSSSSNPRQFLGFLLLYQCYRRLLQTKTIPIPTIAIVRPQGNFVK
jgi:hypothetical protein